MKKALISLLIIFWFYISPYRALNWFASCWLVDIQSCPVCQDADFNNDGVVNGIDYAILLE